MWKTTFFFLHIMSPKIFSSKSFSGQIYQRPTRGNLEIIFRGIKNQAFCIVLQYSVLLILLKSVNCIFVIKYFVEIYLCFLFM